MTMTREEIVLKVDGMADRVPAKACCRCGRPKCLDEFSVNRASTDGRNYLCKRCDKLSWHTYYHEGGGKEAKREYRRRPDVKARTSAWRKAAREKLNAIERAYVATPIGKYSRQRKQARRRLKAAKTDSRRDELMRAIDTCTRAIDRLKAAKACEHELPAEPPPGPRGAYGARAVLRGVYELGNGTYRVKVPTGKPGESAHGGTFATLDAARDAANALAGRVLGIADYATSEGRRKRA